jgi:capsular polysaccharide export protein
LSEPVHIFSRHLWTLRDEIAVLTGLAPRRAYLSAGPRGAVAGWGHKETAGRARAEAERQQLPYIAFEDGMLRSLRAGRSEAPSSLVMDRSGIYYDASGPSDLETLLATGIFSDAEINEARSLRHMIAERRLSKYNAGSDHLPIGLPTAGSSHVLVVDQTAGDASVAGAMANATTFSAMFQAAVDENPDATIWVKLHPEVIAGSKAGYLASITDRHRAFIVSTDINPWALLDLKPTVYTVSSQLGFEALLAGCRVVCFGAAYYAGWGLTDDRLEIPQRRTRKVDIDELVAAVYLRYCRYFDAWRRHPVPAMVAIDQLDFLRRRFHANATPVVCYRIARWKRRAVNAMLDGPAGPPIYVNSLDRAIAEAKQRGGRVASWGITAISIRTRLQQEGIASLAVEDGFVRSAGLGAAFVPPQSLVFDTRGLYYDPRSASDLEHELATRDFDDGLLRRAQALRRRLVEERFTKYNIASSKRIDPLPGDRERLLVPGQVADDWAVRANGITEGTNVNRWLLAEVRRMNPSAFIIYKPHPDVERLGRSGAVTVEEQSSPADQVATLASPEPLFSMVDRVETFCSLTGFEGLLRGLPVTVHGLPFYAGWGLTRDMRTCARRGRQRSLDELVAAALIVYPRYWDKLSGRTCPPEVALDRLARDRARGESATQKLLVFAGRAVVTWRKYLHRTWAPVEGDCP